MNLYDLITTDPQGQQELLDEICLALEEGDAYRARRLSDEVECDSCKEMVVTRITDVEQSTNDERNNA